MSPVTPAPDPGRILYALRLTNQAVERAKELMLRPTGVLSAHYVVLVNVHAQPGLTAAELARRIGVTPQNVTGLVNRLSDRSWIERRRHPTHQNLVELQLTDLGREMLAAADAVVGALESQVVEGLTSAEIATLAGLLARVRAATDAW